MSYTFYQITYLPDSKGGEWLMHGENLKTGAIIQIRSGIYFDDADDPNLRRLDKKAYELFQMTPEDIKHVQTQMSLKVLPALKCKFMWKGDDRWDVQWVCGHQSDETCIPDSFKFEDPWVIATQALDILIKIDPFYKLHGEILLNFVDQDYDFIGI